MWFANIIRQCDNGLCLGKSTTGKTFKNQTEMVQILNNPHGTHQTMISQKHAVELAQI